MVQHRAEETRNHILDAAGECFARRGYDATGVAAICKRAGVTKGAFYHHFPTKQTVFMELLDRWLAELDAQLKEARIGAATVPEEFLRMAGMVQHVFRVAGGRLPIFLEFWTAARHDPAIWKAMLAPYRRYRDFFGSIIEAGIAEGSLRHVDPAMAAQVIVSFAVGLVLQGTLDLQGADWGQVAHEGIRILLEGLENTEEKA